MASFPGSVKTWTALVDASDYPEAADLNTAYDEITAIETGYLTGAAPLNSSASTVASLSVTGGSTLAAATIAGISTFGSDIKLAATKKLYLDGGGNTYLAETAADRIDVCIGGVLVARMVPTAIVVPTGIKLQIEPTAKFYLDGGVNTYIVENSADVLRCVSGGSGGVDLTSGATAWVAVSDERLKTIIEPITNAAAKVMQLRPVIGRFHDDAPGKRRSMLIAQDVQKVLPEAVTDPGDGWLRLAYTEVIPLLAAASQEHEVRIAALEARMVV